MHQITDVSIISISINCTRLKALNLYKCSLITDKSIISLSNYCFGLQELNICTLSCLTDASLIAIANNCTDLQSLSVFQCYGISDVLRHQYKSITQLQAALSIIPP